AARAGGRQNEAQALGVGGHVAPVLELSIARHRVEAHTHVVLAYDTERLCRAKLLAGGYEGVELSVAELARIGENALEILARAGGGRAAKVELSKLELLREDGTEVQMIGPVSPAGVDLSGAGTGGEGGKGNERERAGKCGGHHAGSFCPRAAVSLWEAVR